MRSIRRRSVAWVLGLLGSAMALFSYLSYHDAHHEVEEVFDAELAQTARLLSGVLNAQTDTAALQALQTALDQAINQAPDDASEGAQTGHRYEGKIGFAVLQRPTSSASNASTPSATEGAAQTQASTLQVQVQLHSATFAPDRIGTPPLLALSASPNGYLDTVLAGERWRLFGLHDAARQRWVVVGEREDVRGELSANIALRSTLPQLLGLPVLCALVWLALSWGLRPLAQMAETLKARDPESLAPLLNGPVPSELAPMAAALNRLLLQVTELLAREKRFLANAAHELRTPLAVLRIQAHNATEAADGQDRQTALASLQQGVQRATRVVEQLLTLARLEPGAVQLALRELDLLPLVRQELAALAPLAIERQQELTLHAEASSLLLRADPYSLSSLLQNLVSNAVRHTPQHGQIRIELSREGAAVVLKVQDSGPGIAPALRQQVLERFFRIDSGPGAGLGLSIVARIAELHHAQLRLGESPLGGLEVALHFAQPPAGAGPAAPSA